MAQAVSVSNIARNILKLIMSDPPSQNDKELNSGILILHHKSLFTQKSSINVNQLAVMKSGF